MARSNKDINKDVQALVRQIQRLSTWLRDLQQAGLIDTGNSTDETLGAGGVFTGDWTAVTDRVQAFVTISVTAASAVNGLVFEHSADGVTALHSHSYSLQAGESRHFDEPLISQFFRIVYTDGGAGGDLVLDTKLLNSAATAHAHALSEAFNAEHPANIVRSVLAGFDAVGGASQNVETLATASGVTLLETLVDADGELLKFYAEGDAKPVAAVGIAPLAIRTDVRGTLTEPDGSWVALRTDSEGSLWVAVNGTVSVSGTVVVDAGSGWAGSGLATELTLLDVETAVAASALSLASIDGKLPATLGQKAMAASLAVVIASDQSAIPVSGTVSVSEPVSVDDNGGSLTVDAINLDIRDLSSASDSVTVVGTVTANTGLIQYTEEDVDASITGPAMMIEYAADTLGPLGIGHPMPVEYAGGVFVVSGTVAVSSVPGLYNEDDAHGDGAAGHFVMGVRNTALADFTDADSDYSPLATDIKGRVFIADRCATPALTTVAANASSVNLLASNILRRYAIIHNDSATATLKIKYGATASSTSFTGSPIRPGATALIDDGYTGVIDGIWDAAVGNARITELQA